MRTGRFNERTPSPGNPSVANKSRSNTYGVDDWGTPILKPFAKEKGAMKMHPADVLDVIRDAEHVLDTAHEKLVGGYDAKPTRHLLAKHGKALAGLVGQSVIDELTALSAKEFPESVSESFRRSAGIPRERSPEDLQRFAESLR